MSTSNPIHNGQYSLDIYSDASTTGWGVSCQGQRANGSWNAAEKKDHINLLELKAAFFGLKCFAKDLRNKEILLRIDNTTALSYVNRSGGVQYTHLNDIARDIWQWCEIRHIFVFASYIKFKENIEADEESRRINIDTEWKLSTSPFKQTVRHFGQPQIDLFATRAKAYCPRYVSWKRDSGAHNIDDSPWTGEHSLSSPFDPFH